MRDRVMARNSEKEREWRDRVMTSDCENERDEQSNGEREREGPKRM